MSLSLHAIELLPAAVVAVSVAVAIVSALVVVLVAAVVGLGSDMLQSRHTMGAMTFRTRKKGLVTGEGASRKGEDCSRFRSTPDDAICGVMVAHATSPNHLISKLFITQKLLY